MKSEHFLSEKREAQGGITVVTSTRGEGFAAKKGRSAGRDYAGIGST